MPVPRQKHRRCAGASGTAGPAMVKESLRKRNESESDAGNELAVYGLQGAKVIEDDLEELGQEDVALVKGLSSSTERFGKEGETYVRTA
jgi:hypothetical protein